VGAALGTAVLISVLGARVGSGLHEKLRAAGVPAGLADSPTAVVTLISASATSGNPLTAPTTKRQLATGSRRAPPSFGCGGGALQTVDTRLRTAFALAFVHGPRCCPRRIEHR